MDQDTIRYDSLANRPLPKWLSDQKSGLNTYQPEKIVLREDRSLDISIAFTSLFIFIIVIILTILLRKKLHNLK